MTGSAVGTAKLKNTGIRAASNPTDPAIIPSKTKARNT
jgi:hypothetical protein